LCVAAETEQTYSPLEVFYLFAPDGALLEWIETGVATANCAWGEDGSVLYIAASYAIYRIRVNKHGRYWLLGDVRCNSRN
jgi:hypothetical protein